MRRRDRVRSRGPRTTARMLDVWTAYCVLLTRSNFPALGQKKVFFLTPMVCLYIPCILRRNRSCQDVIIENDGLLRMVGRVSRHRRELRVDGRRVSKARPRWLHCRWMASRGA